MRFFKGTYYPKEVIKIPDVLPQDITGAEKYPQRGREGGRVGVNHRTGGSREGRTKHRTVLL